MAEIVEVEETFQTVFSVKTTFKKLLPKESSRELKKIKNETFNPRNQPKKDNKKQKNLILFIYKRSAHREEKCSLNKSGPPKYSSNNKKDREGRKLKNVKNSYKKVTSWPILCQNSNLNYYLMPDEL